MSYEILVNTFYLLEFYTQIAKYWTLQNQINFPVLNLNIEFCNTNFSKKDLLQYIQQVTAV